MARVLQAHGFARTSVPEDADVLIAASPEKLNGVRQRPEQIVNLVHGAPRLTNKGHLASVLRSAGLANEVQPETFLIDAHPEEEVALRARAVTDPSAVWIAKPVGRGRGIGVTPLPDVGRWLDRRTRGAPPGDMLVQRYVDRPLLLRGRKSEVRSYLLIACTDPFLALYHDGTVRLASKPFRRADWDDPLVHVTNTYRQKQAAPDLWAEVGDGMKWTLERLGADVFRRRLTDDPDWLSHVLRPNILSLLRAVVRAALPRFPRRRGTFQLLGADMLLTDDLGELWLTEIQRGPGLSVDNPVKARVIPPMVEEALAISIEANQRVRAGLDPRELRSRRHFHWVFAENDESQGPSEKDLLG